MRPRENHHGYNPTREKEPVPVVLIGLDSYTGLQTARVFARHGVPVLATAQNTRHFGCRTRHCRQLIEAPARTEGLIDALEQLGRKLSTTAVLVPCIDMSVLLTSKFRDRLRPFYRMASPAHKLLETLADKSSFYQLAAEHGFSVPNTICIRNREQALVASRTLNFPCVLKPALKTDQWDSEIKTKVFRVDCGQDLLSAYEDCARVSPQLIAQQWIEGDDCDLFTCNAYFDKESRPLVTFVSQKLRQWPPEIGVGSLAQECRNDDVLNMTVRLFQETKFQGLAYLEVKRNRTTGNYFLIEANVGRPTGRSSMAEAGGVALHYTMYCDLLDRPLPLPRQQTYGGVKWIYWRRDLRAGWHDWRRGKLSLFDWWRSLRGRKTTPVFSWTDPLPFCADLWGVLGKHRADPCALPSREVRASLFVLHGSAGASPSQ